MSYDVYLKKPACASCGHQVESDHSLPDPTYNLTPIFHLALTGAEMPSPNVSEFAVVVLRETTPCPRGLRVLSGKTTQDTVATLEQAVARLEDPSWRARFQALAPDNGWGTVDDAIYVMNKLLVAAREEPDFVWDIR